MHPPSVTLFTLVVIAGAWLVGSHFAAAAEPDADAVRKSAIFYVSFERSLEADVAGGPAGISTRKGTPGKAGGWTFTPGYDEKAFRVAAGKGVDGGGTLDAVDVLPMNGRYFYPAKGNIAFKKGGWGGSLSMWIKTDADKLLKTGFCDPIQISQRGAGDGGLWFDFNDAKPKRDLRMGVFGAIPPGEKGVPESDPNAPMVRVKGVGFQDTDWHLVVMTWSNLDTGKPDARAALYIDGKLMGELKDRAIAMDWDIDKVGLYTAVNYIGLLDEFAIYDRALTPDEIALLVKTPALLAPLRRK